MRLPIRRHHTIWMPFVAAAILCAGGCGTTKMKTATEQLLLSDAVDKSVIGMDFRPLSGRTVYLDATYIRPVKGVAFVNSDYIISSLRQQIVGAGCLLQDDRNEADLIIEARVGTLGADGYQVTYGLPASNVLSTVGSLLPQTPSVPAIPEISIGRRESEEASAKIAAFAYDRVTRQAVWQSGIQRQESNARDTWVFGIGPFESGTVREASRLAGKRLPFTGNKSNPNSAFEHQRPEVDYTAQVQFKEGFPMHNGDGEPKPFSVNDSSEAESIGGEASSVAQVSFEEVARKAAEDIDKEVGK